MKRIGKSGFSLMEMAAATGLAAGLSLATATLISRLLKSGNDAALESMRDKLVQDINKIAADPRNVRQSALNRPGGNLDRCVNARGTNGPSACGTNVVQANGTYVPNQYTMDLFDAGTGLIVAGGDTPARYDKSGKPCTTPSPSCPFEAVATYAASCPAATPGGPPAANCAQARTYEVFITVRITPSVAPREPIRQLGSSVPGALPVFGACPDGTTVTGLDAIGNPICVRKGNAAAAPTSPGAHCGPGEYLFGYNPQLTNGGVVCRTLSSVCPNGTIYNGNAVDGAGNVIASCTLYGVPACPPNYYANQVNFDAHTLNCVIPGYTTCAADMVQQGNTANGAPNCVPWNWALPSLATTDTNLANNDNTLRDVRNHFVNHVCMNRPVRAIEGFDGSANPICKTPYNDYDGDGWGDVVVGAGDGGGPRVNVLSGARGLDPNNPLANFFAYDASLRMGIVVGLADVDGDGYADILTMPNSPGGGPALGIWYGPPGSGRSSMQFVIDPSGNLRSGYSVGP